MGAVVYEEKKKQVWTCFFLAGQPQSYIATGVGKRGYRTVTAVHEILRL